MFKTITVLVPTRGRVELLRKMMDSFLVTNDGHANLVLRADDDDITTIDYLKERGGGKLVVGPMHQGYRSMGHFFNEMLLVAEGDILMIGNDDMVFSTSGWPSKILTIANQFEDGLFDLGVSTLNETHFPFSIVSRIAVERMGFLWDPRLFWGDIFLRDVMAAFGRCVMVPGVRVEHEWAGHPYDVQHFDPDYWTITHPQAVNEAIAKLIRSDLPLTGSFS